MNSTSFHRTIKEFLIKSLEFILSTRCQTPTSMFVSPQNLNSQLQLILTESHNVRSRFPQIWSHEMDFPLHVFLDVVRAVEGCRPLLLERWEFTFSPADQCHNPDAPHTNLKKSAIELRALATASLQSPAYTEFRGQLVYNICFQLEDLMQWSTKTKPQDLATFPKQPFKIQTPIGTLSAKVQFWKNPSNPEIIPQTLGYRQRLISVETEETKEEVPKEVFGSWSSSSHGSANSTNSNPPFGPLTHFPLNRKKEQSESSNTLSQAVMKCMLPDVGFTPLSPDVAQALSDSSDGELASAGLEQQEVAEDAGEVNEDAKVAVFSLKCERGLKGRLFNSSACSVTDGITSLKQTLANLKATKAQLLEQQLGQLLA